MSQLLYICSQNPPHPSSHFTFFFWFTALTSLSQNKRTKVAKPSKQKAHHQASITFQNPLSTLIKDSLRMASLHHHCHHLNSHHATPISTCTCCCTCTCTPSHYPHPQTPPPPLSDPLLQAIASQLLQHHHHSPPPPSPQPHHQPQHYPPQIHKRKNHPRNHSHQQDYDEEEEQRTLPVVSSLLRRIASLESSLHHHVPFSLRHAAARTIQSHFRAFLVRRSRALRQLQDLAFIKSAITTLKSSLYEATHVDYQSISQETMRLLFKLDSIQGGDPMIRDGKKSISRELIRFVEFIDEVFGKRRVHYSSRAVNSNVGFDKSVIKSKVVLGDQRKRNVDSGGSSVEEQKLLEKLRSRVQKIQEFSKAYEEEEEKNVGVGGQSVSGNETRAVPQNRIRSLVKRQGNEVQVQGQVQTKVKKSVSFDENGNVYRVIRSSYGPGSSGDSDYIDESDLLDGERELMNNLCREVEEIGVFAKEVKEDNEEGATEEDSESPSMCGDERDSTGNMRAGGGYKIRKQLDQEEDDSLLFSAPLPVKMEARAELMNKKQPVRK